MVKSPPEAGTDKEQLDAAPSKIAGRAARG